MILYINCCVREESRTARLAQAYLEKLGKEYKEVYLPEEDIKPMDRQRVNQRIELAGRGDFDDEMFKYARDFVEADEIVIAAPYWDLSFPSLLKIYIENIYAVGLVCRYTDEGEAVGMCKAERLTYITTAGGQYVPDYSYGYLKSLAMDYFGIKSTRLIKAEMLDIVGYDAEAIVQKAIDEL